MEGYFISSAVIIAIVNQLKSAVNLDGWKGFLVAVVLGIVFGFLHWFGLTGIETGFTAGLISSGAYTVAKRIGGDFGGQPNL
jgi:ABC-type uncharacterized transport system permease subunit